MYPTLMLLMIGSGLLSSFSPATPTNLNEWLSENDWPVRAAGREGVTHADIFVDTDGKPQACYVVVPSNLKDFDRQTCAAVMRRGKFTPATNAAGQAMNGMYRLTTIWNLYDAVHGRRRRR